MKIKFLLAFLAVLFPAYLMSDTGFNQTTRNLPVNESKILSRIGPATSSSNVTIAAGGAGVTNCITNIDAISDGAYTLRVLNGGTTTYSIGLAANQGIVRSWDINDCVCSSTNTAMTISVSAGTFSINYKGFTY